MDFNSMNPAQLVSMIGDWPNVWPDFGGGNFSDYIPTNGEVKLLGLLKMTPCEAFKVGWGLVSGELNV